MLTFFQKNKNYLAYLGLLLMIIGLPLSRAMLSIGIIFLFIVSLLQKDLKEKFILFFQNPALLGITFYFIYILISGLWSDNIIFFLDRIRIKLPFLVLPFAFFVMLPITKEAYNVLLKTFFSIMVLCCFWSVYPLLSSYENVIQDYIVGKVLRTPIYHIRFSLMAAMAVIVGFYLLKENLFYFRIEKILLIVFTIFIILYIHVLAVRSGVLAFYVSAFVLLVKHLIEVKYFKVLFAAIICFLIFPYIAYQLSPTFKTKYHYMKYDIEQYTSGNYNMVSSDIRRILSIRSGIDAAKENSTFGVGYGDIEQATFASFDSKFPNAPKENRMLPHNQFIYTYTGLGWVGIVLFMVVFIIPLVYKKAWKNDLVLAIHIIIFSSFLSEYTFETQIGVAFYLLFLLLPLCQYWASLIPLKKQF